MTASHIARSDQVVGLEDDVARTTPRTEQGKQGLAHQVWVAKQGEQPFGCASIGRPVRVHRLVGHASSPPTYTILDVVVNERGFRLTGQGSEIE